NADGAAVRERIRVIRREHGHAAATRRARAAFDDARALRHHGALAFGPGPPPPAEIDAVERNAAPEEQRRQIETQVMTIELRIVSQNFAGRQSVRRAAESAGLTG